MTTAGQRPVFAPWDDPDAKPLIEFRGVTKRFGQFTAIDGIDLDIFTREFFALLGPSGCGKTTLMRMLAGFEDADRGHHPARRAGYRSACRPTSAPVNMMFQSYALFPHLSVAREHRLRLKRTDMPKDAIAGPRGRDAEALRPAREIRASASRTRSPAASASAWRSPAALAKAPKLLLLDEPLGALDKKLREDTQFELMDIQEKLGTTFVIVTHDQEEAMTVASRVAVMDHGQIIQVATPSVIYEDPQLTLCRRFHRRVWLSFGAESGIMLDR
jgi:putrescine transport system ATP-binding protein